MVGKIFHMVCTTVYIHVYTHSSFNWNKWNSSNKMDTIGTEESVLIREVSLFQGLDYTLELSLGKENVSF